MSINQDHSMPSFASLMGTTSAPERIQCRHLTNAMMLRVRNSYIERLSQVGGLPESLQRTGNVIKWDGGVYRDGTEWRPIWPRLLRAIVELQTTPEIYVTAQFDAAFSGPPMTPIYLDSKRAKYRYQKFVARSNICVAEEFSREEREVHRIARSTTVRSGRATNWSFRSPIREAIDRHRISPLVACCIPDICESAVDKVIRDRATTQLAFQFYDFFHSPVWSRISDEIRDFAERLIRFICYEIEAEYQMG